MSTSVRQAIDGTNHTIRTNRTVQRSVVVAASPSTRVTELAGFVEGFMTTYLV